ncbi:bifunctional adenosylcobinamide kinase/adenosylcobinamide-phosphate guanylyltransferase [Sphingomonas sp. LaA6.9]|uniref:bifunctional adenosylcobinamide kinase/adenosylcobinamide-phosphate guanylyltransferase n=1 Tax=Sphingomonas sp. LaA6.9 TaxID=2919914 RepID=UPI001F501992|nr:bifunctional adenosylcobinamide kinase/adenosylcobinamide-phosphate guanylyltransferase [Sphingomonas sp. LaA6.9]MCJ8159666.1 bifunctional adenosylcobinamide kinase/adenosylcobinamide-phosphate guanylyltransferase [Sphingomonas sp. LaA6.9]
MAAPHPIRTLLVLGGARSGKSRYAQGRAEALGLKPVYIATCEPQDEEMAERIGRHRDDRGEEWTTVEAPLELANAIRVHAASDTLLLIDCLTLWASNLMFAGRDAEHEAELLAVALSDAAGPIILVSNEVGLGIVPENALARRFRDVAGRINQRMAEVVDEAVFVAAGLPLRLKG